MEIRRTANAGILLKLDDVSILLDGVCREVSPYLATPEAERKRLADCWPDILAYSHTHDDHCDPAYAAAFQAQTGGVILCPQEIPGCKVSGNGVQLGGVSVRPVPSRHIGKADPSLRHVSYIISGSSCIWFLGDAAPAQWKRMPDLPHPDVMVVPFAYGITPLGWEVVKSFQPGKVVLLHMPLKAYDPYGLWPALTATVGDMFGGKLWIPEIGQTLSF